MFADRYTVADKIDELTRTLKERGGVRLGELLRGMHHRYEMVCAFLAVWS
ncbi:MAG: hypothetical protein M9935_11180 [Kiritimatiellae bacterium]|nr:hypothetical protein [Kiritimatiellia bacterium]